MTTEELSLRFGPDSQVPLLQRGKSRVLEEYLKEGPYVRGSLLTSADGRVAVRETDADGLVNE